VPGGRSVLAGNLESSSRPLASVRKLALYQLLSAERAAKVPGGRPEKVLKQVWRSRRLQNDQASWRAVHNIQRFGRTWQVYVEAEHLTGPIWKSRAVLRRTAGVTGFRCRADQVRIAFRTRIHDALQRVSLSAIRQCRARIQLRQAPQPGRGLPADLPSEMGFVIWACPIKSRRRVKDALLLSSSVSR